MKYDTFLFDFDGTVVNSIEAIVKSMTKAFTSFNLIPPTESVIRSYIGIPLKKIPYVEAQASHGVTAEQIVTKYREIYERPGGYGHTHVFAYDGMKEILQELKAKGSKLGIVSSKMTGPIFMNIEATGLTGLFDVIIGSDQVTHYKPLPETVFLCAQKIGLEDARCALVIGDAHHDIEMGQRAGMDTCAVMWGAGTEEDLAASKPTYLVRDMQELVDLLKY